MTTPIPPADLSTVTMRSSVHTVGPVRFDWLEHAARIAGRSKALHIATALVWLAALRGEAGVPLTRRSMARWGLSRDAAGAALSLLRVNHLVIVWSAPGRARIVVLTEPGTSTPLAID